MQAYFYKIFEKLGVRVNCEKYGSVFVTYEETYEETNGDLCEMIDGNKRAFYKAKILKKVEDYGGNDGNKNESENENSDTKELWCLFYGY